MQYGRETNAGCIAWTSDLAEAGELIAAVVVDAACAVAVFLTAVQDADLDREDVSYTATRS